MRKIPRTVGEIMSRHLVSVAPDDEVRRALGLMILNRVSAVPVIANNGTCVGMLSAANLIRVFAGGPDNEASDDALWRALQGLDQGVQSTADQDAASVMSGTPCDLTKETPITVAAARMAAAGVHRVTVADDQGKAVGIVSTMDLIRVLGKLDESIAPAASTPVDSPDDGRP